MLSAKNAKADSLDNSNTQISQQMDVIYTLDFESIHQNRDDMTHILCLSILHMAKNAHCLSLPESLARRPINKYSLHHDPANN